MERNYGNTGWSLFIAVMIGFLSVFIFLMILSILSMLTSETKYVQVDCVDGNNRVNLEGFKCEKEVHCGGLISFFEDPDCDRSYSNSKFEGGKSK